MNPVMPLATTRLVNEISQQLSEELALKSVQTITVLKQSKVLTLMIL